jgi:hypothetical protein
MLFVDWRQVGMVLSLLSIISLAVAVCVLARRSKLLVKIVVAIIATPTALAALGMLLMLVLFIRVDWNHHSEPSYSPDGKAVARIEYWGGFGNTGGSYVVLRSAHGLWTRRVFDSIEDIPVESLVWKSDKELWIYYSPDANDSRCISTSSIYVRCVALLAK